MIVSTPQDLALIDARKGINMFRRVDVPILGIIENMSYFLCPSCGERSDIFGNGGARAEAEKIGVPFLGEVPLHMDIREKSDAGNPPVVSDPQGPHAKIFADIARDVWAELSGEGSGAAPRARTGHRHGVSARRVPGSGPGAPAAHLLAVQDEQPA